MPDVDELGNVTDRLTVELPPIALPPLDAVALPPAAVPPAADPPVPPPPPTAVALAVDVLLGTTVVGVCVSASAGNVKAEAIRIPKSSRFMASPSEWVGLINEREE